MGRAEKRICNIKKERDMVPFFFCFFFIHLITA